MATRRTEPDRGHDVEPEPLTIIRAATPDDLPTCLEVERRAGQLFIGVGMPDIAGHDPMPLDELAEYQRDGRAWVAVDEATGAVVGYAIALTVDGNGHLEQISVDPAFGRQGNGRALIETAVAWAAGRGLPALTLTTFRDVPWNAPYYRACGFEEMAADDVGPELRERVHMEAGYGLDPAQRVCMRRRI